MTGPAGAPGPVGNTGPPGHQGIPGVKVLEYGYAIVSGNRRSPVALSKYHAIIV